MKEKMRTKLKAQSGGHEESRRTRDLLLAAAKKIFAQQGLEGATVKDIAKAAGVNISLVSYHFNGKDGLYRACLEAIGNVNSASAERILKPPQSRDDFRTRLQIFAEEFISFNLREKDICKILHRDFDSPNPITLDVFKNSFLPMYRRLLEFINTGQANGILRQDLNPDISAAVIFGSLVQLIRMDTVRRGMLGKSLLTPRDLETTISQTVLLLTDGVFAEK